MMEHDVKAPRGARHRKRIVGRGDASGHGSYSGRGVKGQKSRPGGRVRPGFEGGQLPLIKKLPARRGFTNLFRVHYQIVNLSSLEVIPEGIEITPEIMAAIGLIHEATGRVKVLGEGEVGRPLIVAAHRFSASAKQKIQAAGGTVRELA